MLTMRHGMKPMILGNDPYMKVNLRMKKHNHKEMEKISKSAKDENASKHDDDHGGGH